MIKNFLYQVLCGFFLGLSVFAPGFSGSVIAIIMGVYQDIVRIAANPFKDLKANILFCIPLGIGVLISGVLFVFLFQYLFVTYEKATYLLFLGLIAGNIPVIYSEIKKHEFKKLFILVGIITFTASLALGLWATDITVIDPNAELSLNLLILILGGLAGGATMLMPGMSVSMVLMIFGIYSPLLFIAHMLLQFNFTYLMEFCVFGFTALIGLVLASNLIKFAFNEHPGLANTAVLGFLVGSLLAILYQSINLTDPNFSWLLGGIMLTCGLLISMLFVLLGEKLNKKKSE